MDLWEEVGTGAVLVVVSGAGSPVNGLGGTVDTSRINALLVDSTL